MRSSVLALALCAALTGLACPAFAQMDNDFTTGGAVKIGTSTTTCNGGAEGAIRYNTTADIIEFCNGTAWTATVQANNDTGSCTTAKLGRLRYNGTATWEYCNGSAWSPFEQAGSSAPGFFVQTSVKFNGNRGGLSGADATCLTDLQNNSWKFKSYAGTLTASRVKAFLCNSSTCNNLQADTFYMLATAVSDLDGGLLIRTDSSGRGPGDQWEWTMNFLGSEYNGFNQDNGDQVWTNRGTVNNDYWATTPAGTNSCSNWSSSSSGQSGVIGKIGDDTGSGRWNQTTNTCDLNRYLICIVHPE